MEGQIIRDFNEVDVLVYDAEKEKVGLFYTYPSEGDKDFPYKCMMYQNRIENPEASNSDILDCLGEGKAYIDDSTTQRKALKAGFDFWLLPTPKRIYNHEVQQFKSYSEAIEEIIKTKVPYMIISVQ